MEDNHAPALYLIRSSSIPYIHTTLPLFPINHPSCDRGDKALQRPSSLFAPNPTDVWAQPHAVPSPPDCTPSPLLAPERSRG